MALSAGLREQVFDRRHLRRLPSHRGVVLLVQGRKLRGAEHFRGVALCLGGMGEKGGEGGGR